MLPTSVYMILFSFIMQEYEAIYCRLQQEAEGECWHKWVALR